MDTILEQNELHTADCVFDDSLVSIIMPNYNSSRFIKKAIDSVVAQTYKNWELIIVDDCSSDNSLEIIKEYNDDRIYVVRNATNSGTAVSRNNAIKIAKGRWIAFLDSDDLWKPEKLEKQIFFMESNVYSFSFTDYAVIDKDNKILTLYKPKKDNYRYKDILKHNSIGCSTVIYDKKQLGEILMPEQAIKREDLACWLRILRKNEMVHCLHECLTEYRVCAGSVSSNKTKMAKYQWNVYRKLEKLSIIKSFYYMLHWAIRGVLKYR